MTEDTNEYNKKPLWQFVLIYLIVGGLIYAGIYYANYKKSPTFPPSSSAYPSSVPTASQSVSDSKVEYTATGFAPSSITIAPGTTVTWENTGTTQGNVSSDPHPAHTNYSPLNLGMLKSGSTVSLKFDTVGTYGYHNHLNSSQSGTVIVK